MKTKVTLIFILTFIFFGCSEDARLLRDAEKYLINQLNDPKSYQKVSFEKYNTITELGNEKSGLQDRLRNNESDIKLLKNVISANNGALDEATTLGGKNINKPGFEKSTKIYYELHSHIKEANKKCYAKIDSLTKIENQLQQDSIKMFGQIDNTQIDRIIFKAEYRAMNEFGGYVKQSTFVVYHSYGKFDLLPIND